MTDDETREENHALSVCVAGYANQIHRPNEEVICFHSVEPPWISAGITPSLFVDPVS